MKVFNEEINNCGECPFKRVVYDCYTDYACSEIGELIYDLENVHKDCPFKTENSFTKDQFNSIGFESIGTRKFHKYVKKGKWFNHVILHLPNTDKFTLVTRKGSSSNIIDFKASSFPHLKFILDSLI